MRIDDFILFGRTVPEDSKKYGLKVCAAGYSEELKQFMRVYPIEIVSDIKALDIVSMELGRSNKDNRLESWALKTRNNESILSVTATKSKTDLKSILEKNVSDIDSLNASKKSLGIIKPESFTIKMKRRKDIEDPMQLSLFDDYQENFRFKTAKDFFLTPYLIQSDSKQKCLQFREWGVFELMRKNPATTSQDIISALRIDEKKDVYFIVGNMNQFRNVWLIIKAFVYKKENSQLSLF